MANDAILPDHTLSKAGEDYLEAIYRIALDQPEDDRGVRSVDVAEALKVSKASVNKALSLLKEQGMVEQSRYGRVTLTEEGEKNARQVWRAHRALRTFLEHDLHVDEDTADAEACLMEHSLSHSTMSKLVQFLESRGITIDER
ncbi:MULTISPECIES: metal-dependent transcriptional regulator [Atopobiaceae]|uniref:metal-dependent transcriptional regulator n=1 Tax=Atopobiaceae TaxID=1643824 RepID=UPI00034E0418|nr:MULTISPECIES: metal-dependent transcriptional regulator [Atopobiaceae]EPD78872.1 hypothetical protein HMPREF1527_01210 [Atopobium sp. oral taxon 199 str. F0494]